MSIKSYIVILSLLCVAFIPHKVSQPMPSYPSLPDEFRLEASDAIASPAETTCNIFFPATESRLNISERRSNIFHRICSPVTTAGSLIPRSLLSRYFHVCKPLTRQHFSSGTVLERICVLII